MTFGVDRSHLRLVVERIADTQRRDALDHAFEHRLVQRLVQEQPAGRAAGLPLPSEIHAGDRDRGDLVRVHVGERDQRVLAAELKRDVLDAAFRRRALDGAAGGHRAGEGDAFDIRMARQRVAGWQPRTGDDVDHARRQHLAADFGQHGGRERARFRWFQHHAVAGHQRGGERIGRELDGMIERDDASDHAVGLADGEVQVFCARRDHVAFDLGSEARVIVERIAGRRDIGAHLADGVAGIDHLDPQDIVRALAQLLGEPAQQLAALLRFDRSPGRMGGLGGCDRAVDVLGGRLRHVAKRLLVCRIDRFEPLTGLARHQFPADEHHAAHEIGLGDVHDEPLVLSELSSRPSVARAGAHLAAHAYVESWVPDRPFGPSGMTTIL